ncbi:2Fe-2S iron-sulfur cluster binding domain-containing protein [Duganella sp. FT135W]|uniref:2Fe-2S iron-sulfur cluster binding domain-containing protein n=1 Tax=Duganella flavida TaxID=2692175 RepID=A0A6L8K9Q7_9BURK|nr:PDR/VanB family oxidoreductase [Duganella flavida]MYM24239.1 2Fe-2S iron-sulfur cluster binding domain-containing protein [Duganella flavida]
MEVRIHSIADSGGVRVFELRPVGDAQLPPYEAGAHIDVTLGNGLMRQYSLCCREPGSEVYRIAVKREPQSRGGSAWLHDEAKVGMTLQIGSPRNAFALVPQADIHLLFAGGIGITPILSMAYALQRRGQPFQLYYFVRDAASAAFATELQNGEVLAGLDPEQTKASIRMHLASHPAAGTHVYVCGPAPFMQTVAAEAANFVVHQESFGAPPISADGDMPFMLALHRSGRQVQVAAGRTALACLQEAGVELDCSCEVGVCGTCRTAVLEGTPHHFDSVLSDEERQANNCFMPCVSRALTPVLVLDL